MNTLGAGILCRLKVPLLVFFALTVHCLLLVRTLPPSAAFSGQPFETVDVLRSYFPQAHAARQIFCQSGQLWGYDPYFNAGYRTGLWNSMGKKGWEMWSAMWPWPSEPIGFAICYYLFVFLTPLLPVLAARRIDFPPHGLVWVLFISLVVWHFESQTRYNWEIGGVMRFAAAGLVVLLLVEMITLLQSDRLSLLQAIYPGTLAAGIFYLHPTEIITAACGCAIVALQCRRRLLNGKRPFVMLVALVISLLLASFWLGPLLLSHEPYLPPAEANSWYGCATWKNAVMDFFSDRGYARPFDRRVVLQATFVMATVYWVVARERDYGRPMIPLCLTGGIMVLLSYSSSVFPALWSIQPYRYLNTALMLCILPTSIGIRETALAVTKLWTDGRYRFAVTAMLVLLVPPLTACVIDSASRRSLSSLSSRRRHVVDYVASLPPHDGRILIDDQELAAIVPFYTRREVLGGVKGGLRIPASGIEGDLLFNKPLKSWDDKSLENYLELYDVRYLIVQRDDVLQFTKEHPRLLKEKQAIDRYRIFEVISYKRSAVYRGSAKVTADYNRIEVRDIEPGRVVLKYHYDQKLVAANGVPLAPVYLLDDPAPFISFQADGSFNSLLIQVKY